MDDDLGHGHSVASWTGVAILLLGSTLVAVGIFFTWGGVTWTGVGLCVVGVLAWVGLNAAGFGGPAGHASNTQEEGIFESDRAGRRADGTRDH